MDYKIAIFVINCIVVFIALLKLRRTQCYILSLSYCLTLLLHFFGSLLLFYSENWWIRYVSEDNLVFSFILTQGYIFIFSLLIIFKRYNFNYHRVQIKDVQGVESHFFAICVLFGLLCIGLIFKKSVFYNFIVNPSIDKLILANYRNSLTFSEDRLFLYFKNIYLGYFSILIFAYYCIRRVTSKNRKNEFIFYSSIFVVVFGALLTMSKAPILKIILLYSFIKFVYAQGNVRKLSVKAWFSNHKRSILAGVVLLIIMFGITKGFDRYSLVDGIFNRVFMSQHVGLPNTLEFFPEHFDYLGVTSISPSLSRFLGVEYNKFSGILMESVNSRSVKEELSGYLSTIYIAESFAIGGLILVFISASFVLFLLLKIDGLYNFSDYPLLHSLYALLFIKIPFLLNDSLKGLLFNVPLIICIFIVIVLHVLNKSDHRYQLMCKKSV